MDRTREFYSIPGGSQSAIGYYTLKNPPYSKVQNQTYSKTAEDSYSYMNDTITQGWRNIIANGGIVNNNMFFVTFIRTDPNNLSSWRSENSDRVNTFEGSGSVTDYYVKRHSGGSIESGSDVDQSVLVDHYNDSIKVLKQQTLANLDRTPYNFAEDVAEFHETAKLLRHPLTQLTDLASETSRKWKLISREERGLLRSARHIAFAAKQASKAWLSMRFAYGSIYYSAESILDEYHSDVKNKYQRRRAGDEINYNKNLDGTYVFTKYPGAETVTFNHTVEYSSTIRVGCLYEVSNPIDTWRERNNLRLKAVPVTVWNILPYTWALDRLYDVSKTIKGLTNLADPTLRILAAWVSTVESTVDLTTAVSVWNSTNNVSFNAAPEGFTKTIKSRSIWHPNIADTKPIIQNPFGNSVPEVLDILTLLTVKLHRFSH
jgi:hypothetical protein